MGRITILKSKSFFHINKSYNCNNIIYSIVKAEAILSSEENNDKIREQSMDMVSMVCEYLTSQERFSSN